MPAHREKPVNNAPPLEDEVAEKLKDALDGRYKDKETFEEDVKEAFHSLPKENIENAAAILRDLGNEAMKSCRYDEAVAHYTSVLAAYPSDHEILANRSVRLPASSRIQLPFLC